ncbi:MAG: hypothetical protein ABDI20_05265 [Candidatus Bipolaricaulaceae bacterium]
MDFYVHFREPGFPENEDPQTDAWAAAHDQRYPSSPAAQRTEGGGAGRPRGPGPAVRRLPRRVRGLERPSAEVALALRLVQAGGAAPHLLSSSESAELVRRAGAEGVRVAVKVPPITFPGSLWESSDRSRRFPGTVHETPGSPK